MSAERSGLFDDLDPKEARRRLEAVWQILDRAWVGATPQTKQTLEEIEAAIRPELQRNRRRR